MIAARMRTPLVFMSMMMVLLVSVAQSATPRTCTATTGLAKCSMVNYETSCTDPGAADNRVGDFLTIHNHNFEFAGCEQAATRYFCATGLPKCGVAECPSAISRHTTKACPDLCYDYATHCAKRGVTCIAEQSRTNGNNCTSVPIPVNDVRGTCQRSTTLSVCKDITHRIMHAVDQPGLQHAMIESKVLGGLDIVLDQVEKDGNSVSSKCRDMLVNLHCNEAFPECVPASDGHSIDSLLKVEGCCDLKNECPHIYKYLNCDGEGTNVIYADVPCHAKKSSMSAKDKAGIAVGVVLFTAVVVLTVLYLRARKSGSSGSGNTHTLMTN